MDCGGWWLSGSKYNQDYRKRCEERKVRKKERGGNGLGFDFGA